MLSKRKILTTVGVLGLSASLACGGIVVANLYLSDGPANAYAAQTLDSLVEVPSVNVEASEGRTAASSPGLTFKPGTPSPSAAGAGEAYGFIEHELFGRQPILMGDRSSFDANQNVIDRGTVVSYASREKPGEVGNFAVIGHRVTHGAVFSDATSLRDGDVVEVGTTDGTFSYEVVREAVRVEPNANHILDNNPLGDSKNVDRKLMTIITCGPWLSNHREVIVLELIET